MVNPISGRVESQSRSNSIKVVGSQVEILSLSRWDPIGSPSSVTVWTTGGMVAWGDLGVVWAGKEMGEEGTGSRSDRSIWNGLGAEAGWVDGEVRGWVAVERVVAGGWQGR